MSLDEVEALKAEIERLKTTNRNLHRRVQKCEAKRASPNHARLLVRNRSYRMTDQTTETRVAEIEKRAVDALGIGAFGKAVLVCRSDIPWLTAQLRAAWKREAAAVGAVRKDHVDRHIGQGLLGPSR